MTEPKPPVEGEIVDKPAEKSAPANQLREKRKAAVDRKKTGQWLAGPELSDTQKQLVRRTIARECSDDEFIIFLYRCRAYWLDPLKGEISVQIRNKDNPAKRQMVVIVQRDGYLTIAHRSGQFNGLESGSRKSVGDDELIGFAKTWNKSANQPTSVEVYESEYNPAYGKDPAWIKENGWKLGLWTTKPRTMIQKVAESQALRRAFNISGVYEPAEVASWQDDKPQVPRTDLILEAEKKRKALTAQNFKPKPVANQTAPE